MPAASPSGEGVRNRRSPPRLRPPHRKASTEETSLRVYQSPNLLHQTLAPKGPELTRSVTETAKTGAGLTPSGFGSRTRGETTAGATTGRHVMFLRFPPKAAKSSQRRAGVPPVEASGVAGWKIPPGELRALGTPTPDAIDGFPVFSTGSCSTASPRRATATGGFPDRGMWRPRCLTAQTIRKI
ncbi:hypothetical protein HW132_20910 [Brasilonema sp. CT11]|nr:hypothetical protein [Brasilonema sp. CT11]